MPVGFEVRFVELARPLPSVFSRCDLCAHAIAYVCALCMLDVPGNWWAPAQSAGHKRPFSSSTNLPVRCGTWTLRTFVARHSGEGEVLDFIELVA